MSERVWVELVRNADAMRRASDFVQGEPRVGAIVTFAGTTRIESDSTHGDLVRLEYEAYEPMAIQQMRALAAQALDRFQVERAAIVHRLGPVAPAETSVMIAVASRHRSEGFEACRWLIESLKKDVPIWKREVYSDGFERWIDPVGATSPKFPSFNISPNLPSLTDRAEFQEAPASRSDR